MSDTISDMLNQLCRQHIRNSYKLKDQEGHPPEQHPDEQHPDEPVLAIEQALDEFAYENRYDRDSLRAFLTKHFGATVNDLKP